MEKNKTLAWIRRVRRQAYEEWVKDPQAHRAKLKKTFEKHKERERAKGLASA